MSIKRKTTHSPTLYSLPATKKRKTEWHTQIPNIIINTELPFRTHNNISSSLEEPDIFETIPSLSAIEKQWDTPILDQIDWKRLEELLASLINIEETNQEESHPEAIDCFQFKSPLFPSLFGFFKEECNDTKTPVLIEKDTIPVDIVSLYDHYFNQLTSPQ